MASNAKSTRSPPPPPRLCPKCHDFLGTHAGKSKEMIQTMTATTHPKDNDNYDTTVACSICGGLWGTNNNSHTTTATAATATASPSPTALQQALQEACEPYGGLHHKNNLFAQPITISLGGRIRQGLQHYLNSSSNEILEHEYAQALKKHVIAQVQSLLPSTSTTTTQTTSSNNNNINRIRHEEQQGYLGIHILCIPSRKDDQRLELSQQRPFKKARRKGGGYAQRVYGHSSQGGDPRLHLEERLQANGWEWTSWSQAITTTTTTTTNTATPPTPYRMTYQVAVFRHPMFFYGYYTKHRRDVSQTPFIVMDKTTTATNEEEDGDDTTGRNSTTTPSTTTTTTTTATVLGVTSVEEQICQPLIAKFGISKQNNTPHKPYGACKFHASGREDMNVRMILKKKNPASSSSSSSSSSCGRPFCVQLVDALMPLPQDDKLLEEELQAIVHQINHTTPNNEKKDGENDDDNEQCWYGQNPMGVGIHHDFKMVSASYFSNLQANTEDKIKHYGCHCWSEQVLPQEWTWKLPEQTAPLVIHQPTPLRVLHRRPNLIRDRAIYQATAKRVDDHHFRLELSTQAGTYIKEFVHGDLGRTQPNMNTLLQTKTNLLLLDCEGIEMSGTTAMTTTS